MKKIKSKSKRKIMIDLAVGRVEQPCTVAVSLFPDPASGGIC